MNIGQIATLLQMTTPRAIPTGPYESPFARRCRLRKNSRASPKVKSCRKRQRKARRKNR